MSKVHDILKGFSKPLSQLKKLAESESKAATKERSKAERILVSASEHETEADLARNAAINLEDFIKSLTATPKQSETSA